MSQFMHKLGRRKISFSDHALDRWWERCEANGLNGRMKAMDLLREKLDTSAQWERSVPAWSRVSLWHKARAEGSIIIDPESAFIINRNANGDLVAVTYIEKEVGNGVDHHHRSSRVRPVVERSAVASSL